MTRTAQPDPLIGSAVGSYEVVRKLGEGGMGAVYEIRHPGIGKRLALKLLHPQFASQPAIVRRFFDEARAVNLIGHPNIVDILDFNRLEDGRPYLTMEYLQGEDLTARCKRRGPMGLDEVRALLLPVCRALAAAHGSHITHRDLKPDNIFIEAGSGSERVVVLDFGIAKLSGESEGGQTATGTLLGTPAYMAPEQATGQVRSIGPWTDVYALGCIAYQMLTGAPPFAATTLAALIHMQAHEQARPLSSARPDVPSSWNQLVMTALAKDPAARHPSAGEFANALEAIDVHRAPPAFSPAATNPTVLERPERPAAQVAVATPTPQRHASENRWVVPVIAAAMLVGSGVAVYIILAG